ncbi:MAG: protein phosphatase 2C domain-containing protein [Propionicimonas sp.]|uniref:PP2C family protein-serine/threonine phosphatase n=1 Tax=Propionicimonas sp. TaxID=1955623 RepID=UPI002B1F9D02|nr:protein phosphatase 2C domain-containing protein [Propionicimonas sp.]MEA4943443.1 protein phosphatase 2C domain-containing protein [Propionicimonas sp.]
MSLALRYRAHSEIGLVRKNNQDSAYVSPTMLVVADGMGGAAAGDLASAVAIKELRAVDGDHTGQEMLAAFDRAISNATEQVSLLVRSDPTLEGMGTTVCGVMFDGEQLGLANIGDSRAYRFRDGALTRLSRDHSWVQTLVDEGRITEAEALEHPHRSLILRVVNGQSQHIPDLELAPVELGDRLLICSDGLCGAVTDAQIEALMTGDLEQVMQQLVQLALDAGGLDNITIVLADVVEGERTGPSEVLGSAAIIDLDGPFDTTTMRLPSLLKADEAPSADPLVGEQARYSPTASGRPLAWLKTTLVVLLALVVAAGGGWAWYSYTQRQYYVGPDGQTLGIFRGIPEPLFNLPLNTLEVRDPTRVDDLPPYYQEQVRSYIRASSMPAAQDVVSALRTKALECIAQREERARATQAPSPSSSATPDGTTPASSPTGSAPASSPSSSQAVTPSSPAPSSTPTPAASIPPAPEDC